MTEKMNTGRICEYLVKVIIETKTGWSVLNLNDERKNHPTTDLRAVNEESGEAYEISVKAKQGKDWPSVKGISKKGQYIVFVSLGADADPEFYILSSRQWIALLKKILPARDSGGKIVNGTIEWNWEVDGKIKRRRGSLIKRDDLSRYKDNWSILPGVLQ